MDFGSVAENENAQLQHRNGGLYQLEDLQKEMEKLAGSETDLSARMVFSEEEKLKISKDLIDLQIETNKMKEQYETENFELKNMILSLENRVLELELCSKKVTGERNALQERLYVLETSWKELTDEYIILKSNYLALGKELDQEVMKNEELSLELLNLANARSNLPRTNSNGSPAMANESSAELERVRAMVHRLSAQKVKNQPEDVVASERERQKLERNLLGNQDHIKVELEILKKTYDSQQQKLEDRMITMGKELQEAKGAIGDTQHKLVEQSAVLLTSQSQLQEVEAENSQLQLRLKELNEEYRSRLAQYIKDVADYMDSKSSNITGPSTAPADLAPMKHFVDSMLKDIRASYKSREEQLAKAARGYKKRMKNLVKKHENLLIAYGLQREQIQSLGSSAMDCGPAELHFSITDPELLTNTTRELNRLREDKAKLEMQLHELQKKRLKETSALPLSSKQQLDEEGWAEVRKQLQEFTHTTQEDLEQKRSQLLTRAIMAEEQVSELQEYIDKHLARYKQEIIRLRNLAGSDVPRVPGAGTDDIHSLPRARRTVSHEP
ncbi:coiled-coil domain-containing protein 78 [Falco biarmicus]|uniref:coiled-coil domain-containing protein 78 n=1 Tax=Falco cherrug TaxID=345164 RepID=UPI00188699BC|nr:coiled-coil domain-containing protein 78 [Falco cherrug]XP_027657603.2 coiled-coil domain-containing protein 78 [Falco cherrug]XP_037241890.1 coiled-coil domain-containing protein 78 [Falco rusticolus]XP_037241891.1 coiled-coil domain-containing protein 78 [Falco rusticolus]XP_056193795.1 coiled-coil domain-containing protein 78 [Falco biarmicus]XP_056193796.1 coiled-coil domain-containing protein 78 [Falco biarmicus]